MKRKHRTMLGLTLTSMSIELLAATLPNSSTVFPTTSPLPPSLTLIALSAILLPKNNDWVVVDFITPSPSSPSVTTTASFHLLCLSYYYTLLYFSGRILISHPCNCTRPVTDLSFTCWHRSLVGRSLIGWWTFYHRRGRAFAFGSGWFFLCFDPRWVLNENWSFNKINPIT